MSKIYKPEHYTKDNIEVIDYCTTLKQVLRYMYTNKKGTYL